MRYTASRGASVGAVTYRDPSGPKARWNAATLAGTDANSETWPFSTRRIEPDRSPTYNARSGPNAMPHATPRSVATVVEDPSRATRCTLPSNLDDTYNQPSGLTAIDVGFGIPETKGSRDPSGRTTNTDTGDSCPLAPLNVTYRFPSASNAGLSTW